MGRALQASAGVSTRLIVAAKLLGFVDIVEVLAGLPMAVCKEALRAEPGRHVRREWRPPGIA